ncbi:hypothetical protein AB0L13_03165 [Saccharopolyspora shandongensis]|uniref:hypothetical protein n=1 Tax=Saccharopolyspora shandongensis TaxID=418495 RepID=UPI0034332B4B
MTPLVLDPTAIKRATPELVLTTVRDGLIAHAHGRTTLATHVMARPDAATLAVFGTGEQARLQVEWLVRLRPIDTVLVHGRSQDKTRSLCEEFNALGLHARPALADEAGRSRHGRHHHTGHGSGLAGR